MNFLRDYIILLKFIILMFLLLDITHNIQTCLKRLCCNWQRTNVPKLEELNGRVKKLVTRFNLDQSFVFCDDHITLWSSFDKKLKLSRMSV